MWCFTTAATTMQKVAKKSKKVEEPADMQEPGKRKRKEVESTKAVSDVYAPVSGTIAAVNEDLDGSEDTVNSLECVFVQNPQAGNWNVEVFATSVVQDNHVETPAIDADYGLVVVGGQGTQVVFASFSGFGQGCAGSVNIPATCPEMNPNGGTLEGDLRDNEYCYRASTNTPVSVVSFDIFTRSTTGGAPAGADSNTGLVVHGLGSETGYRENLIRSEPPWPSPGGTATLRTDGADNEAKNAGFSLHMDRMPQAIPDRLPVCDLCRFWAIMPSGVRFCSRFGKGA